jgi:Uma2 family endonuclease
VRTRSTRSPYPDILAACGRPKVPDKYEDVLTHPRVMIEVISESTASFDRTEKFICYQLWNESLVDYLLIAQDQPFVEHFERRRKGAWLYHVYQEMQQVITLRSIKCSLSLADVYDRIRFAKAKKWAKSPAKKSVNPARSSRKSAKGKSR